MEIKLDDLTGPEVHGLLQEHLQGVRQHSPPESIHALDLDGLRKPEITFWTVWDGPEIMGCGALKELDAETGEVKSMRTSAVHLRKGVASHVLQHILGEAKRRGYQRIYLETGSMAAFEPARQMYAKFGFVPCGRFGDYPEDPNSFFMFKDL
ncbi:MAG: GNAT family N-acetyltransferase [Anaerolineales bacterium]|nr:GNAT family N-acetyltransferase [Anaerolineales bacterium]